MFSSVIINGRRTIINAKNEELGVNLNIHAIATRSKAKNTVTIRELNSFLVKST